MCGKKKALRGIGLLVASLAAALLTQVAPVHAATGINQQLTFQGKVVNSSGVNLADGTYDMEFKVYQDGNSSGTGSTLMWTEDYLVSGSTGMPSTGGITVSSGTFNVNLGSICALTGGTCGAKTNTGVDFNQDTLWLSFQVGNTSSCTVTSSTTSFHTACGGDGEMTPFIRLTAVPYAMNANKVGGLTASQLVQLSPSSPQSGNISLTTGNSVTAGTVNANTLDAATASTALVVGSSNANAITLAKNTTLSSGLTMTLQGNNALTLGSTTNAGGILFQDGTSNNFKVTLTTPALTNSYSVTWAATGATGSQCLQSTSGSTSAATTLQWGSCDFIAALGAVDGAGSANANGATVSSGTLYLNSADATHPGVINTTTQTFGGNKTFNGTLTVNNTALIQPASDSTTVFQVKQSSGAGGNPVLTVDTTNSQTILRGINSDASIGSELGDLSAGNNNFSVNWSTTDWTVGGGNTTATHNTGNTTALVYSGFTPTAGATYQITYTVSGSPTAGESVFPSIGANSGQHIYGNVTSEVDVITAGNTAALRFTPSSNWNGTISAVSIKLITVSNAALTVQSSSGSAVLEVRSSAQTGNSFTGLNAGQSNITGGDNSAFGYQALKSDTIGSFNTAVGYQALRLNATGGSNTALGYTALNVNTIGASNTAVGASALQQNNTGSNNAALGYEALLSNLNGSSNAALGYRALKVNTTGGSNTAVGNNAGSGITTGSNNLALGNSAGSNLTTGNNNIIIGNVNAVSATADNQLNIGNVLFGNVDQTTANNRNVYINTTNAAAFEVQNASSEPIFVVDTTTNNLITNPGFEAGVTGWSCTNCSVSPSQNVTANKTYNGLASLKFTTDASAGTTTAKATSFTSSVTANGSTSYTFSFYMMADNAITLGSTVTFTGFTGTNTCTLNDTSVVTTGYKRFFCTVVNPTSGTLTDIAFTTTTVGAVGYIDAAQLVTGSTLTPYQIGAEQLRGPVTNPAIFQSASASVNALTVLDTSSNPELTVDTLNDNVEIGSTTTDTTMILLQPDSYSTYDDSGTTCTTTINQGAFYYNTASGSLRTCRGSGWEDVVTTAALGLQLFGVVPDSGSNPGDLAGIVSGGGPCQVIWTAVNAVSVNSCTAYSGGRKVIVQSTSFTGLTGTSGQFRHICLNGTDNQPALSAAGTEVANLPTWSVTAPVLCLADIKFGGTNTMASGGLYDLRTYTTTNKTFTTVNAAVPYGTMIIGAASAGLHAQSSATVQFPAGVVVASSGVAQTAAINVIYAYSGPASVKAISGSINAKVQTSGTAGYALTSTSTTVATIAGIAQNAWSTTCTSAANCQSSLFFLFSPR